MRTALSPSMSRRNDHCLFCKRASDSIEHIAYCPIIIEFYRAHGQQLIGLSGLLALYIDDLPHKIIALSRLLSSVYLAHNILSHHEDALPSPLLHELLARH